QLLSSVTVANFSDTNPSATANNLAAVINWGDGQSSTGSISPGGLSNTYAVTGSHVYTAAGPFTGNVTITDPSGQSATLSSAATIAGAAIVATGSVFSTTPGQTLTHVTVASFTDLNPNSGNIAAVIDWGDGQTTKGDVNGPTAGVYTVTG